MASKQTFADYKLGDYLAHVIEALAKQRTVMSKHYLTTDTSHAQTALSC